MEYFRIHHSYDIGDQGVTVMAPEGIDVRRAAVYIQFKVEEWFGDTMSASNLGIAASLVAFYGCKHSARSPDDKIIDMYSDRESMSREAYDSLIPDPTMAREGLRAYIEPHVFG